MKHYTDSDWVQQYRLAHAPRTFIRSIFMVLAVAFFTLINLALAYAVFTWLVRTVTG